MAALKQGVKKILVQKEHKNYEKQVKKLKISYHEWIENKEKTLEKYASCPIAPLKNQTNEFDNNKNDGYNIKNDGEPANKKIIQNWYNVGLIGKEKGEKCRILVLEGVQEGSELHFDSKWLDKTKETDVIVFVLAEGSLSDFALPMIADFMSSYEEAGILYGDEDVLCQESNQREKPWLKPDWSPDTFLSYFYFGSLVAVRTSEILRLGENRRYGIYELLYFLIKEQCQKPNFKLQEREGYVRHLSYVLFHGKEEGYSRVKDWKLPKKAAFLNQKAFNEETMISVIIPSKDHPQVLATCLHSLLEKTLTTLPFELIVVDNGSSEENQRRINELIAGEERIHYYYEPMPFNFSKMCNSGADKAKGNLLLFLNDDMEIIQKDWLDKLAEKASLPYVGAVGAKLLYPESDLIQHAGITNLKVGPAHKLQFLSDQTDHYYGRNRYVHDMMGVTGACLMIKKADFEAAGGFYEALAVAFNDVDLCYTLIERQLVNVQRNDVVLYHHESLSRGKDGESEEKQLRLLKEKDLLYERHQKLYGVDPYYHKNLTTDRLEVRYTPACQYQVDTDRAFAKVKTGSLPKGAYEEECLVIGMELAIDLYKWKYGVAKKDQENLQEEEMGYYFQGYSFIIGADNACYDRTLVLENRDQKNAEKILIPLQNEYRNDIRTNLRDQLNVDLTGFSAKVRLTDIPKGTYRFAMLAEDRCSRQKLLSYSSWVLKSGESQINYEEP